MSKRRGRPRKDGVERGETGRIKTSAYVVQQTRKSAQQEADARSLGRWRAARIIVEELFPDTRLGSPLGRMLLLGSPIAINEAEFEAGTRLATILERYDRIFLGASRNPRAQDLTAERGSSLMVGPDADLVARTVEQYRDAENAIFSVRRAEVRLADGTVFSLGPGADLFGATKALLRVADWRERAAFGVVGLKALARFWKLDDVPAGKIRRWGERLQFERVDRTNSFEISYE